MWGLWGLGGVVSIVNLIERIAKILEIAAPDPVVKTGFCQATNKSQAFLRPLLDLKDVHGHTARHYAIQTGVPGRSPGPLSSVSEALEDFHTRAFGALHGGYIGQQN